MRQGFLISVYDLLMGTGRLRITVFWNRGQLLFYASKFMALPSQKTDSYNFFESSMGILYNSPVTNKGKKVICYVQAWGKKYEKLARWIFKCFREGLTLHIQWIASLKQWIKIQKLLVSEKFSQSQKFKADWKKNVPYVFQSRNLKIKIKNVSWTVLWLEENYFTCILWKVVILQRTTWNCYGADIL